MFNTKRSYALMLQVLVFVHLAYDAQGQRSLRDRFHVDSLFPSIVSDTLNVLEFAVGDWVQEAHLGKNRLNSLHGIHNYHPYYEDSPVRNDLGNIGSANHTMLFDLNRDFGFNFRSGRSFFWLPLSSRRFLLSEKMYSNVQYSNGQNRENYLVADFTRGFGKLLDMGFKFTRINSLGFYSGQTNTITDVSVFSAFHSNDNRYRAALIFDYSNLRAEENGGIANDSVFENNITTGRDFIAVNLPQSSNHWKGFDIALEQRFILTKHDSTKRYKGLLPAIGHSFSIARHSMIYRNVLNSGSSFYENIFSDSITTYDSTNLLGVTNAIRFELLKPDSANGKVINKLSLGVRHSYHRVAYDTAFTENINNLSVFSSVRGEILKNLDWRAEGNFMVLGYNLWDLKVDGQFDYKFGGSSFSAFVNYHLFRPDYITDNYRSNHFVWDNDWVQTQHLKTGITYNQERLRLKATFSYHLLDNLVVYGVDRTPFQSQAVNQLMMFRLQEHARLRWFHFVIDGAVQWRMSGDDIRVPAALGRGMIYYQNDLFKKRLRLQVGVETSYTTSYFANAYNPALSDFHLQNTRLIGNYPFIDVFLNLRVKKFRAFVQFTHINSGWLGYTYYHVPHHPVNDFAWHFGVNWAFLD